MKRTFDIFLSLITLLVFLPLLFFLFVAVGILIGKPVLFCQERPGKGGRPFQLIKFRTMREALDSDGTPLPDNLRMTKFGSFLRSSSLDELPSLWNVLKGDLSLVGPRPLLMEYLPLYNEKQARRHEVKPGITGWAQVNGRNAISWEDKFELDVWYVDHQSFWLDLKIMLLTIKKVIIRDGISADGHVTIERFKGTNI